MEPTELAITVQQVLGVCVSEYDETSCVAICVIFRAALLFLFGVFLDCNNIPFI